MRFRCGWLVGLAQNAKENPALLLSQDGPRRSLAIFGGHKGTLYLPGVRDAAGMAGHSLLVGERGRRLRNQTFPSSAVSRKSSHHRRWFGELHSQFQG